MSFIDYTAREINCKIVYYGPGLAGKTTNLQYIYNKTRPELRSKLISLATETERSLFFSFVTQTLPPIRGFTPRFHLYTVPGPVFYDNSRRMILTGVDGLVFVADSQVERKEANVESLEHLESNMATHGYDLHRTPLVMQYNKRDLPHAMPIAELDESLATPACPRFEAVAPTGLGVFETLKAIAKAIVASLLAQAGSAPGQE